MGLDKLGQDAAYMADFENAILNMPNAMKTMAKFMTDPFLLSNENPAFEFDNKKVKFNGGPTIQSLLLVLTSCCILQTGALSSK